MRRFCAVIGLLSAVAFAGSANAAATIDLVWATSGTANTSLATSSTAVLNVVLTNDVNNIGGSVSIDYNAVAAGAAVTLITNNPNGMALNFLPIILGPTVDTANVIESFNAAALPPYVGTGLAGGQSYLMGTITFHQTGASGGSIDVVLGINDSIAAGTGAGTLPASQVTLGSATITAPEPGTIALSAVAMLALFGVHRTGRRNQ